MEVFRTANPYQPDPDDVAAPEHIEFPTTGGRTAFGNYYAPTSQTFAGPEGELPPLIVTSHGGPTASAFSGFATGIQLFASRGYAVLDVDYGGSTGYGKAYRKRLEGEWGVVDVDDCVAGAKFLADKGLVDGSRQAVAGGSASGFTTLAALAFTDQFDAGCTYFGIGDLRAFVKDTHKFESRYLESLLGPWPEAKQVYLDRSPSLHAEKITAPCWSSRARRQDRAAVGGGADRRRAVRAANPARLPALPGEDHGFRGHDAIIRSFGAELSFYAQVFGFEPADDIERSRSSSSTRPARAAETCPREPARGGGARCLRRLRRCGGGPSPRRSPIAYPAATTERRRRVDLADRPDRSGHRAGRR
jgi:dipeptidyl aminopeptidase/acylaminoacyl peptidase